MVVVNRWDRPAIQEQYSYSGVARQVHEFHRHLEREAPDRARSIAAHVLRIFRQIRAAIDEENSGQRSLRILLHLLASAAAGNDGLLHNDLAAWGITPEIADSSHLLSEASWRPLYNDLFGTGRYEVPSPHFQLVLRHASGVIFQDAHLEAQSPISRWLPGFELPATIDPS